MRALSIQQPYATAALTVKLYENRKHPPPSAIIGQRIAIHASKRFDKADRWGMHERLQAAWARAGGPAFKDLPLGALLGTVLLQGYVALVDGRWQGVGAEPHRVQSIVSSGWRARGSACLWVFAEPAQLLQPIPCDGALGLWRVPSELAQAMASGAGAAGTAGPGHPAARNDAP